MHTGKQKQINASYQASLVNRHIRRFTGHICHYNRHGLYKKMQCQNFGKIKKLSRELKEGCYLRRSALKLSVVDLG